MRARGLLGMVLGSLVVAAACSGGDDGGLAVGGGGGSITDRLAALPAPDDGEQSEVPLVVAYGDLAAAARIAGVQRPDDLDDQQAVERYVLSIAGGTVEGDGGDRRPSEVVVALPAMAERMVPSQYQDVAADVGWTVVDVDAFVERQTPPENVLVLDGRFDAGRLDDAMGQAEDGVWVAGDPDGDLRPGDGTAARRLGEPLWLSLVGDRLVVTGSAEGMEAARDIGGAGRTLADDATFAGLARALDGEDVYTALLSPAMGSPVPDMEPQGRRGVCDQALAEEPLGVGVGMTDDDGPVLVVALLHDDEAAAQANAEAVERAVAEGHSVTSREPWSEHLTVDRVTADGGVTVARLRLTDEAHPRLWQQIFHTRDPLIAAC